MTVGQTLKDISDNLDQEELARKKKAKVKSLWDIKLNQYTDKIFGIEPIQAAKGGHRYLYLGYEGYNLEDKEIFESFLTDLRSIAANQGICIELVDHSQYITMASATLVMRW